MSGPDVAGVALTAIHICGKLATGLHTLIRESHGAPNEALKTQHALVSLHTRLEKVRFLLKTTTAQDTEEESFRNSIEEILQNIIKELEDLEGKLRLDSILSSKTYFDKAWGKLAIGLHGGDIKDIQTRIALYESTLQTYFDLMSLSSQRKETQRDLTNVQNNIIMMKTVFQNALNTERLYRMEVAESHTSRTIRHEGTLSSTDLESTVGSDTGPKYLIAIERWLESIDLGPPSNQPLEQNITSCSSVKDEDFLIDTQSLSSRKHRTDDAIEHVDTELGAKSKPSAVLSHILPTSSKSTNSTHPATVLSLEASADGTYEVVNTLPSRRLSPEDFEGVCECCIFWLFSPENFSSIERQACSGLKKEISHLITHIIDHHGLIRGRDPLNASRKYLASCQTKNPLIKAKGVCEKCSSIDKWNDEDLMDSAHYGIVLCLRCWYTFNKRDMQDHLAGPLCAYNAEKPKREKVYNLYTTFCSETRPPSTPPWPSIPSSDQQSLPSPSESSSSLGVSMPGELLEPLLSPNLGKPADTAPTFASGGDSTTISLAPDDIFTSGENPTSSNHQVATTDTSIRHPGESVEFEADKVNGTDDSEEEPDKPVEHTNDVASLQSFDDDIQSSSSSYARMPHVIVAERQIGTLLAGHPGVSFVLEESIDIMPKDRLRRNIRRSLKLLYLRLREETQSNVQVLATRMFKGRNSRTRISRQTVEEGMAGLVTNPGSEEDAERPTFHKDRAFLDNWLSSLQCTEQIDEKPQDLKSLKETHDESDSSTDSGSNVLEQYQAVQVAEDFLIRGTAFRAFLTELTLSLLPVHLRQIMKLASWGDIELIDTAFKIPNSDRIKSSVENLTGSPWNWWPMAPPKIPLKRGHVRMNWKCHCGKPCSVDITPSQARIIERIVNNLTSFVENKENTHSRQSVVQSIASWFGRRSEALLPTSTSASQNNHLPSSGIASINQAQEVTAIAAEGNKLPSDSCDLRILFGVPTGPKTLHLTPILVTQQPKSEVFPQMQKEHKRIRGRIRAWFSFWQLSHCNFVKFESIARNVVVACGQSLPEANDIDYDFSPKPASLPPIHPHVFEAAFNSCAGGSCRRLFPPHECYEFEETIYIPRIPKKKTPISSGESDVATWGLEARYCISCFHVILYHVLILIPPFALWGFWMTKHPGDIQSASVPMTVVVAMISMFWSATGILKQFRGEL